MNMTSALRDSWYFFSHNLVAIARLCLPLIVLEGLLLQQVTSLVDAESATLWRLLAGLLFYPLYSAALILFLDARSHGVTPRARDLLAHTTQTIAEVAGETIHEVVVGPVGLVHHHEDAVILVQHLEPICRRLAGGTVSSPRNHG